MNDILMTGSAFFKIDVPYELIETGKKGEKPMIVYLHGFDQNIEYFKKKSASLLNIQAYHLFIQAPYPVYNTSRNTEVSKWGRAWYLYDGNQDQFLNSMEKASQFIDEVVDSFPVEIQSNRFCVFGYSMGGYLGGYYSLSRYKKVSDLVMVGSRIKTEAFKENLELARQMNICAIHGVNDESVYPEPQEKCIKMLKEKGFNATFKSVDAGHQLTPVFFDETRKWLIKSGYIEC